MTRRKANLAICLGRLGGELLGLGDRLVDGADHVEGRLRQIVVFAGDDALECLDRVLELHEHARGAGEHFGDVERLAEEALDLARARHHQLVLFGELIHAQNGDDVLQRLVLLQHTLHRTGDVVVLLADDTGVEHARGRVERIDRREDRLLGDRAAEHRRRIQMGERGRRRRVGQVVGGHVNGLERRDGTFLRRSDAFLQVAHLSSQRGLVTDGARRAAEERGHFGAGLRKAEDVVHEQEHVLVVLVAEILGHGERGERNAETRAGRLVHLAIHEADLGAFVEDGQAVLADERMALGVLLGLDDAGFDHFVVEVVALTSAFTDAREHRDAAVELLDVLPRAAPRRGTRGTGSACIGMAYYYSDVFSGTIYEITSYSGSDDFYNVGGPETNKGYVGMRFIATGTTANNWGAVGSFGSTLTAIPKSTYVPTVGPIANGSIVEVIKPSGYLSLHHRNVSDLTHGLENSYYKGCKNTAATTLDGTPPIETFITNPNTIRVNKAGRDISEPIIEVE